MARRGSNELLGALGAAVRSLRMSRGLTQEQLSEGAGLHTTYISDVERGRRNGGLINIDRLAAALAIDLPTLMSQVESERHRRPTATSKLVKVRRG